MHCRPFQNKQLDPLQIGIPSLRCSPRNRLTAVGVARGGSGPKVAILIEMWKTNFLLTACIFRVEDELSWRAIDHSQEVRILRANRF